MFGGNCFQLAVCNRVFVEVITSTAIAIYFGDWIKSVISINLITLLLLVHVVYIGIRCYVKEWMEERGYC